MASLQAQDSVDARGIRSLQLSGSLHWFGVLGAIGEAEGQRAEGILFGYSGQLDLLPERKVHAFVSISQMSYSLLEAGSDFGMVDAGVMVRLSPDRFNALRSGRVWLENYAGGGVGVAYGYPESGDVRRVVTGRVVSDILAHLPVGLRSEIRLLVIPGRPNAFAFSLSLGPRVSISGPTTRTR